MILILEMLFCRNYWLFYTILQNFVPVCNQSCLIFFFFYKFHIVNNNCMLLNIICISIWISPLDLNFAESQESIINKGLSLYCVIHIRLTPCVINCPTSLTQGDPLITLSPHLQCLFFSPKGFPRDLIFFLGLHKL